MLFLIHTLFMLVTYLFLVRLLFEWSGVDFYNSISQALYKITAPVLLPLQRFLPNYRGINLACLVLLLVFVSTKFWIISFLADFPITLTRILIAAIHELVADTIQLYTLAILVMVIASWISPHQYNAFVSVLYKLTDPLMRRARRWIPPIGVIDISPLVVLLALQFLNMLFTKLLVLLGQGLM